MAAIRADLTIGISSKKNAKLRHKISLCEDTLNFSVFYRQITESVMMKSILNTLIFIFVLFHALSSWAQTENTTGKISVGVGEERVVAGPAKDIKVVTPPQFGTTAIQTDPSDSTKSNLIYQPMRSASGKEDKLTYQAENIPQKEIIISITPIATTLSSKVYFSAFETISLLFALAVILESALAVLFNWRPFVETFNPRAIRPLISIVSAYIIVSIFKLDLITTLINASTNSTYAADVPGLIITALVIAGGSAGVNNLLVALGYREVKTPATTAPQPAKGKAWLAVSVARSSEGAVGPVKIFVCGPDKIDQGPDGLPRVRPETPLAGMIDGPSLSGLRGFFMRDRGRYPNYGGCEVAIDTPLAVVLEGSKAGDVTVTKQWGPHSFAVGAVVDLKLVI